MNAGMAVKDFSLKSELHCIGFTCSTTAQINNVLFEINSERQPEMSVL